MSSKSPIEQGCLVMVIKGQNTGRTGTADYITFVDETGKIKDPNGKTKIMKYLAGKAVWIVSGEFKCSTEFGVRQCNYGVFPGTSLLRIDGFGTKDRLNQLLLEHKS